MTQRSSSVSDRKEYFEWQLSYDRTFAQQHHVGAVVKYTQDKTITTSDVGDDIKAGVDRRHQGLAGQVTYGWKDRYFLTYNFGYNGSENFAKHHQYGFFPAYSVAWNIAEEPIVAKNLKWVNMFKLRYSYGKVGNDYMSMRFPYLSSFKSTDGFQYADIGSSYSFTGLTYSTLSSQNVTWEKSTKKDLGLDFTLFNSAVTGTIDYFHEQRDGIYMVREYLPPSIGLNSDNPSANVGSVLSKGFDGNIALQHKIGKVDITWRGNITYSKNKILEDDEQYSHYPYTQKAGFRVNQARGLVSLGLFKDYEDIRNSPTQKYGTVMPGDIKYKDINGDGIVDDNDIVAVGSTTKPNLVYGFGVSGSWEGFDLNLHFQGVGKSSFFIDGYTVYPFSSSDWGNILTDVVDSNR
jgi:TonB-linked SusC/RagA family outer membrane protein